MSISCDVVQFMRALINRKYLIYQFTKINMKSYATSLRTFDDMSMIKFIVQFWRNFFDKNKFSNFSCDLCLNVLILWQIMHFSHIQSHFDLFQIKNIFFKKALRCVLRRNNSHVNRHDFVSTIIFAKFLMKRMICLCDIKNHCLRYVNFFFQFFWFQSSL